jgi:hypothetical protein
MSVCFNSVNGMPYINKCPTLAVQFAGFLNKFIHTLDDSEQKGIFIVFNCKQIIVENAKFLL